MLALSCTHVPSHPQVSHLMIQTIRCWEIDDIRIGCYYPFSCWHELWPKMQVSFKTPHGNTQAWTNYPLTYYFLKINKLYAHIYGQIDKYICRCRCIHNAYIYIYIALMR